MGGEHAVWMWTDPPYGVDYERTTPEGYAVANDNAQGLPALLGDAFAAANDNALAPGAPFYIAHPSGPAALTFGQAVLDTGWRFHQTLVWVKHCFVLGHSDYHHRHECLLYGWKPGPGGHRWYGGRTQHSVLFHDRPMRNHGHPTVKPTPLIVQCLENSSRPGDLGYEPFAGSGSTVVAAETAGRLCYAVELLPPFVAVALERLERAGLTPSLTDPGPTAPASPDVGPSGASAEPQGAVVLPFRRRRP